jgi:hypothetical protein
MIDDESRRRDDRLTRTLRDIRRRVDAASKLFMNEIGYALERDIVAADLVRDFFTRRARARPS